jgi:hypothetical protein
MFAIQQAGSGVDMVAHIIQAALTPVFLLSGIATLLNVFSTRLGRVADRVDLLAQALETAGDDEVQHLRTQLTYLKHRSLALDAAVVLGSLGGAATCGTVLTLFVGTLRSSVVASLLYTLFGAAILCTFGALALFVVEMLMAGRGLREEVRRRHGPAA